MQAHLFNRLTDLLILSAVDEEAQEYQSGEESDDRNDGDQVSGEKNIYELHFLLIPNPSPPSLCSASQYTTPRSTPGLGSKDGGNSMVSSNDLTIDEHYFDVSSYPKKLFLTNFLGSYPLQRASQKK